MFSLTMGCGRDVNVGYLPLFAVELDNSEPRLENFEPALRCKYSIFLDRGLASFAVYMIYEDTLSRMATRSPCATLDIR